MPAALRIAILITFLILTLALFVASFWVFGRFISPRIEKTVKGRNDPQANLAMPMAFCAYLGAIGWFFAKVWMVVTGWVIAWIS
jgi:hypothetical protein